MKAEWPSEILVFYHNTTWHHDSEYCSLNLHHYRNLISSLRTAVENWSVDSFLTPVYVCMHPNHSYVTEVKQRGYTEVK
jgi:hypothetical protein